MCWTAHGEQCSMAEIPPNRTHCNVTGNTSALFTAIFFSLQNIPLSHIIWECFSIHALCTAAVGHRELSGVVDQPSARRGAAGAGWGELCRRYQLCLRKYTADGFKVRFHIYQGDVAIFLYLCAMYCMWRGFSIDSLTRWAVFPDSYKQ